VQLQLVVLQQELESEMLPHKEEMLLLQVLVTPYHKVDQQQEQVLQMLNQLVVTLLQQVLEALHQEVELEVLVHC